MEETWAILDCLPISFQSEEEQTLLSATCQLVTCFEEKFKGRNGRIWEENKLSGD